MARRLRHPQAPRGAVLAPRAEIDAALVRAILPAPADGDAEGTAADLRLDPATASLERKLIPRAPQASGDTKAEAARLLGVSERRRGTSSRRHGP